MSRPIGHGTVMLKEANKQTKPWKTSRLNRSKLPWLSLAALLAKVKTRVSQICAGGLRWLRGRPLVTQVYRFAGVGGLTTVGTFLLYQLLILLLPYWLAFSLAFAAGIAFSFAMNSVFVFQVQMASGRAVRYILVYLASYGLSLTLLAIAIEWLGFSEVWAPIPVIAIMTIVNFAGARLVLTGGPASSSLRSRSFRGKFTDYR